MGQRLSFISVAWRALGKRFSLIVAAVTATPPLIDWVSRRLPEGYLPVIPSPWMWSAIACLFVVAVSFFWRIFQLEKIVVPKIELAEDVDEITEPASGPEKVIRFLRLEVTNPNVIVLDNCLVELEELIYPNGSKGYYPPIGLITQNQSLENRWVGPFELRGGQRKFIHVASLDERVNDSEILLRYETDKAANPIPRTTRLSPYKLKIKAYGGGTPVPRSFLLYVDDTGRLTMVPDKS